MPEPAHLPALCMHTPQPPVFLFTKPFPNKDCVITVKDRHESPPAGGTNGVIDVLQSRLHALAHAVYLRIYFKYESSDRDRFRNVGRGRGITEPRRVMWRNLNVFSAVIHRHVLFVAAIEEQPVNSSGLARSLLYNKITACASNPNMALVARAHTHTANPADSLGIIRREDCKKKKKIRLVCLYDFLKEHSVVCF